MTRSTFSRPHRATRLWRAPVIVGAALALAGAAWLVVTPRTGFAEARDADGSRMQARSMMLGSSQSDSLAPPRDGVDWRSFKVSGAKAIKISLSHTPASASLSLSLTDARGTSVASASSSAGKVTLAKTLQPGIYYLSVSARARADYTLRVE